MGNPNSRGQQRDKPFRDAIRMEAKAAEAGEECVAPKGSLRWIARQLLYRAGEETAAAGQVGDRLDGKPVQEQDVTVRRDAPREKTDAELAEILAGADRSSEGDANPPLDPAKLN